LNFYLKLELINRCYIEIGFEIIIKIDFRIIIGIEIIYIS